MLCWHQPLVVQGTGMPARGGAPPTSPAVCTSSMQGCLFHLIPHPTLLPPSFPPVQSSLDALRAPGLLLFLHLGPAALTLWLLGVQGVLELRPLRYALGRAVLCCCSIWVQANLACRQMDRPAACMPFACRVQPAAFPALRAACGRCRAACRQRRWQDYRCLHCC